MTSPSELFAREPPGKLTGRDISGWYFHRCFYIVLWGHGRLSHSTMTQVQKDARHDRPQLGCLTAERSDLFCLPQKRSQVLLIFLPLGSKRQIWWPESVRVALSSATCSFIKDLLKIDLPDTLAQAGDLCRSWTSKSIGSLTLWSSSVGCEQMNSILH